MKPARSDTQPGTVEAEVDVNAGSDANRTAEAQTHSSEVYRKKGRSEDRPKGLVMLPRGVPAKALRVSQVVGFHKKATTQRWVV
jgi:hypothetical protein